MALHAAPCLSHTHTFSPIRLVSTFLCVKMYWHRMQMHIYHYLRNKQGWSIHFRRIFESNRWHRNSRWIKVEISTEIPFKKSMRLVAHDRRSIDYGRCLAHKFNSFSQTDSHIFAIPFRSSVSRINRLKSKWWNKGGFAPIHCVFGWFTYITFSFWI